MTYTFEVAVDSIESAQIAQDCGASRIELVADLGIGGITPSYGMVKEANNLNIPIYMMIRPRRGDFVYTDYEFGIMREDIKFAKSLRLHGVVFGILLPDGRVDLERLRELTECVAPPLTVTFHRAFDMTANPQEALEELIYAGVDNVLTSGQKPTAEQGLPLIAELVKQAKGRINIMPGSGINPSNIKKIVDESGTHMFHFSAKKAQDSPMQHRNPNLQMGADSESEYQRHYADPDTIKAIITNARKEQ